VVFAGSVVRQKFDWSKIHARGQVNKVLNYVATADWVVAIFPKGLQTVADWFVAVVPKRLQILRLPDLGSAGFDGFPLRNEFVDNWEFVSGAHSAALDERNWDSIAHFVLNGDVLPPPNVIASKGQSCFVKLAAAMSPLIWIGLFCGVVLLGWLLWHTGYAEWVRTLMVVALAWVVWKIVTRL
jgi:hypothetical protein